MHTTSAKICTPTPPYCAVRLTPSDQCTHRSEHDIEKHILRYGHWRSVGNDVCEAGLFCTNIETETFWPYVSHFHSQFLVILPSIFSSIRSSWPSRTCLDHKTLASKVQRRVWWRLRKMSKSTPCAMSKLHLRRTSRSQHIPLVIVPLCWWTLTTAW